MSNYETIVTSLFDILNCDKITNVQYFAISEEIFGVFSLLFKQKILGLEKVFTKVFELFDSLLVLCFSYKKTLKYTGPASLDLPLTLKTFSKGFLEIARKLSIVTNK